MVKLIEEKFNGVTNIEVYSLWEATVSSLLLY